jgi:hypothetical protein
VRIVIITTPGNPILRWMKGALTFFTEVTLFGVLVISMILFVKGTWYVPEWVGWLIGLGPLAIGIGFLTYHVRNITLASGLLNSLNPIRVDEDMLGRVWTSNLFSSYSVSTYNLMPIGIQDAIDMLRNMGIEVSP